MQYSERFENFWLRYGDDDKVRQKGSKRKAYESWQKVGKKWAKEEGIEFSEEHFAQHVARGYNSNVINRRAARKARQFVPPLPHVTTWLNQWRFEEEHETSTGELKRQSGEIKVCAACSSANEIIGRDIQGGWICRTCDLEIWKENNSLRPLLDKYPKKESESWPDWSRRVYHVLLPKLAENLNAATRT